MSAGGGSLHKKDWLKLGAVAAAGTAGAGALGMGPLAGLLGGATVPTAAGVGALPAAGMGAGTASLFGPTAAGAAATGLGASEAIPMITAGEMGAGIGGDAMMGLPGLAAQDTSTGIMRNAALNGFNPAKAGKVGTMLGAASMLSAQNQPQPMAGGGMRPQGGGAIPNTQLYPQQTGVPNVAGVGQGSLAGLDPNDPKIKALLAMLAQQQGGMA